MNTSIDHDACLCQVRNPGHRVSQAVFNCPESRCGSLPLRFRGSLPPASDKSLFRSMRAVIHECLGLKKKSVLCHLIESLTKVNLEAKPDSISEGENKQRQPDAVGAGAVRNGGAAAPLGAMTL